MNQTRQNDHYFAGLSLRMENILIIKTGAAGDVVRTTSLLNVLQGNIYWITSVANTWLLPDDMPGLTILAPQQAPAMLKNISFDLIVSLEENRECAAMAVEYTSRELAGVYLSGDQMVYTHNAAHWFDMSRISRYGLQRANRLKAENVYSYQECIFKMTGKSFTGEPYRIYSNRNIAQKDGLTGIEKRSGNMWPDKQWWGYDQLVQKLGEEGRPVKVFEQRHHIREYLDDIAACAHVVSGDSLAMHVAMAYNKTCTAIFNCTSPQEIYDYGLLRKVVSPLLNNYYYASTYDKEVIESIPLKDVYDTIPL
ncbi:MAG: hypothetical protein JNK14_13350 [Chitinophagaceae bacterium]|nr:hypothetical protein [Chitinophagaceae bacterium]